MIFLKNFSKKTIAFPDEMCYDWQECFEIAMKGMTVCMTTAHPRPLKSPLFFRLWHAMYAFVRHNVVFCIALVAACVTMIIVPPDSAYLTYIDFRTISCLFCTLAVVGALKGIGFFTAAARRIVEVFHTLRSAVLALVFITFFGSMLIANDMALLTFLPLGWLVLSETGKTRHTAFVFIMQNIAANLGGMLTPFGNPQNLYLYSYFNIPTSDFMLAMLLPFAVSVTLIVACCLIFVPRTPLALEKNRQIAMPPIRLALYLTLFVLSLLMVFRLISPLVCTLLIVAVLLFADKEALLHVDYPLLLTFVCFFIFASNLSRMEFVNNALSGLIDTDPLLVSTLSCQGISNVPTAILFSRFTDAWRPLLIGVNIGGVGTIISSLASLITFREFQNKNPGKTGHYLVKFSVFNVAFLAILILVCKIA